MNFMARVADKPSEAVVAAGRPMRRAASRATVHDTGVASAVVAGTSPAAPVPAASGRLAARGVLVHAARRLAAGLALGLGVLAGAQGAVVLQDDEGRTLRLERPAQRIVSLSPHLTELLFAVGAGDRVVGTVAWSDHPAAARAIPRIGDATLLDMEAVAALRPDLILAWRSGTSAAQRQRLSALGVPVFASESRRLAHIATTLRQMGELSGHSREGEARAAAFETALAGLRRRYAGRPTLEVFYQVWHRPLMTVNGSHLISEALEVCGARNVFAGLAPLTPTVSEEAVVRADPDAIVTGSVDPAGPDNLDLWRGLKALRATREGHVLVVNPDTLHRASDRALEGVAELCAKLDRVRADPPR